MRRTVLFVIICDAGPSALVIVTATVMAGRTGGAYAVRIDTMQRNKEIGVLTLIGIPVSDDVVLPALLALAFTMPCLDLHGCLVGVVGVIAMDAVFAGGCAPDAWAGSRSPSRLACWRDGPATFSTALLRHTGR